MGEYKTLKFEVRGEICVLTLNRPKSMNAFNNVSFMDIKAAIQEFEADAALKCAVIKGTEKVFSAGDDIKYMTSGAITNGDDWVALMQDCVGEIGKCRKPVIAALSGVAMGGGFELALMCDMIIAADNAKISLPEITIGAIPICGGISKIAKCAGAKWAKYLCMTGERITPELALSLGLVQKVVPYEQLDETVMAIAEKLAMFPTEILFSVKRVADTAEDTTGAQGLISERDFSNYISRTGIGAEASAAWVKNQKSKK